VDRGGRLVFSRGPRLGLGVGLGVDGFGLLGVVGFVLVGLLGVLRGAGLSG